MRTFCFVVLAVAFTFSGVRTQDARELSVPTQHLVRTYVTASTINSLVSAGYRMTDIERRSGSFSGMRYDATFVHNSGPYATNWWWYNGLTESQLNAQLATNQARPIDLQPYVQNGTTYFTCIMVDNTGANAKAWWWYWGSTSYLSSRLSAHNARLVDLDRYTAGGTTYYSGIMIRNTGPDYRTWWWYTGVTASSVGSLTVQNQARIYDLDAHSFGLGSRFDVIMIRDVPPVWPQWHWYQGIHDSQIGGLLDNYGDRAIDVESYVVGGTRYWSLVTINNSNELTTQVGNLMRSATDGTVGCWLQHLNGPNLASLNGETVFEPCSTMKTLHHVHAMNRVSLGMVSLSTPITVYTATMGTCPLLLNPVSESLQTVLTLMMQNSDNNRTRAISDYFGPSNINNTASFLGMSSTSLNHTLGCGGPAMANPNQTTLSDLSALHQGVANGLLGSWRETFYDIMLHSLSDLSVAAVIDQEAASIGGFSAQTLNSFKAMTRMAHKGGSYDLNTGSGFIYHRAEFGFLSLPFFGLNGLAPREYGFGAFVNDASVAANADTAIWTHAIPEMLRPTIRAALQTWTGVFAGTVSYGSGCGSPAPYSQTASALPRIGSSAGYQLTNGFSNSLTVLVVGFSDQIWSGVPLPASLAPYGGAGCSALCDQVASIVTVANGAGQGNFNLGLANDPGLIGLLYLTQGYSIGSSALKSSNGLRNTVGL